MPIVSLLSRGRTPSYCGPRCWPAMGDSVRDDTGDLLGGVETGAEKVLGQRERSAGSGVGVSVATTDAPSTEHGRSILRLGPNTANGVAQPP
jgi:hypothetical protein